MYIQGPAAPTLLRRGGVLYTGDGDTAVLFKGTGDAELIDEVLGGENAAFGDLVERHQQKVLGFCLSMLGGREAAEDAAQEIFIKAFTSLPDFRGGSSFSTWLYRIAFNHCSNLRRAKARARQESFDALSEASREKAMLRAAPPQPAEEARLPAGALEALPAAYRAVIALRLEGENYAAIAEALGISEDAVKARLRRARAVLRGYLRHLLPPPVSKNTETA